MPMAGLFRWFGLRCPLMVRRQKGDGGTCFLICLLPSTSLQLLFNFLPTSQRPLISPDPLNPSPFNHIFDGSSLHENQNLQNRGWQWSSLLSLKCEECGRKCTKYLHSSTTHLPLQMLKLLMFQSSTKLEKDLPKCGLLDGVFEGLFSHLTWRDVRRDRFQICIRTSIRLDNKEPTNFWSYNARRRVWNRDPRPGTKVYTDSINIFLRTTAPGIST